MPKGVLWRNGDAHDRVLRRLADGDDRRRVRRRGRDGHAGPRSHRRSCTAPGTGSPCACWLGGGTVHLLDRPEALDPADVWSVVERERIEFMLIVGDAFARPLVDELDRRDYDLAQPQRRPLGRRPAVRRAQAGAARPPPDAHDRRRARVVGGRRAAVPRVHRERRRRPDRSRRARRATCCRPTCGRVLAPGDDEIGWLAKSGRARPRVPPRRRQDGAAPTRSSTACATSSPATARGCTPTAASSCRGATP